VPDSGFGQEEVGLASRQLVSRALFGTLVTLQTEAMPGRTQFEGFPYGSVASFADAVPSTGMPILLLSQLERNIINWESDPRCTLAIQDPVTNGSEPMMMPRTTLFGSLVPASPPRARPTSPSTPSPPCGSTSPTLRSTPST